MKELHPIGALIGYIIGVILAVWLVVGVIAAPFLLIAALLPGQTPML